MSRESVVDYHGAARRERPRIKGGILWFVAVPLEDPSLPSFTGKFTTWGGFNQNGTVVNGTFTFNVRGTGSDGSTFSNHVTDHFNTRPDGTVNQFFHCH